MEKINKTAQPQPSGKSFDPSSGRYSEIGDSRQNADGSVSTLVDNGDGSIGTHTTGCPEPEYPVVFDPSAGIPIPAHQPSGNADRPLLEDALSAILWLERRMARVYLDADGKIGTVRDVVAKLEAAIAGDVEPHKE